METFKLIESSHPGGKAGLRLRPGKYSLAKFGTFTGMGVIFRHSLYRFAGDGAGGNFLSSEDKPLTSLDF
jgi:hypothetical protein